MPLGVTITDELEARLAGPDPRAFRVGVVLPLSGVLGQVGPSALEAVTLAGREIRSSRGRSERALELVLIDSGRVPRLVAESVAAFARDGLAEAFVGLHTSDTMVEIERTLGDLRVPYVFTPGHEDVDHAAGILCAGESPAQLTAGIARVMRDRGVHRWAVVGTDYVWPRAMSAAARTVIEAHGGAVVLDRLVPVGAVRSRVRSMLRELVDSGAEAVVINMPGRDLTATLLAMRAQGLDRRLIRYSGSLEENALYALHGDRSGNLYSALHSFVSLDSPRRVELNRRYAAAFGEDSPVLNSWAEHCYDATHFLARLESSGLLLPERLAGAVNRAGGGSSAPRPEYDVHLAVATGMSFSVL